MSEEKDIYPIVAFGHLALRKETLEIKKDHPELKKIIQRMFKTMYNASGVGLAGPQVGISLRIFVVDGSPMDGTLEDDPQSMLDFKKVFINPEIIEETGEEWAFEEGCLSIPDLREDVWRPEEVLIEYQDENFKTHRETYTGLKARIIQHEYDHLEGILFTDHLSGLKKKLVKSRLNKISKGKISPNYPMKFSKK